VSMQLVLLLSLLLLLPMPLSSAIFDDGASTEQKRSISPTNSAPQFAVQLPGPESENTAREIAERYGLKLITKVGQPVSGSLT
jgi:hypothetical protein